MMGDGPLQLRVRVVYEVPRVYVREDPLGRKSRETDTNQLTVTLYPSYCVLGALSRAICSHRPVFI